MRHAVQGGSGLQWIQFRDVAPLVIGLRSILEMQGKRRLNMSPGSFRAQEECICALYAKKMTIHWKTCIQFRRCHFTAFGMFIAIPNLTYILMRMPRWMPRFNGASFAGLIVAQLRLCAFTNPLCLLRSFPPCFFTHQMPTDEIQFSACQRSVGKQF